MAKTETPAPKIRRPNISVLERRLASPHGEPSVAVQLVEPGWECRWFNSQIAADHVWRAKNKGWEPVLPSELADPEQIGGFVKSVEGYVTRGEKSQEVLMKMPADWRKQIQQAKTTYNNQSMRPGKMKAEVANAAGAQMGDQAGSFIEKNVSLIGDVKDSREVIHRSPEVE